MRELGWVEGKNFAFEGRFADGRAERLPELAVELVRLKVDLIVANGTPATLAARQATTTVPIVGIAFTDPVRIGLVASLARPGGNVTGLAAVVPEGFGGKRLDLLKQAARTISRVAVLVDPANPAQQAVEPSKSNAEKTLRLKLQFLSVAKPEDIESAFQAAARERADGLAVSAGPLFFLHRTRIAQLALKYRLPTMFFDKESVKAGGLLSYGPNFLEMYPHAARYVDKILRGAKPADLPVEQPTGYELAINLKTAKALGLTIPPSLLARADQVIE